MSFVPKPKYPDVPKLPGVPQLIRASTAVQSAILPIVNLGAGIGQLALSITSKPKWGVYRYRSPIETAEAATALKIAQDEENAKALAEGREPQTLLSEVVVSDVVIQADSIFRLGYSQEYSLPTNPLQDGAFATFNKVGSPYEIELRMIKGGTLRDRADFLGQLESVGASLNLFMVITPERTYLPVNMAGFSVVREGAQGAYFFTEVDVRLTQIREVTPQYSTTGSASTENAQDPSSLPVTNLGTLNSAPPPSETRSKIDKALLKFRANSKLFTG